MQQLTEAEAWRKIGDAFDAKADYPELQNQIGHMQDDLAMFGICFGLDQLASRSELTHEMRMKMEEQITAEVDSQDLDLDGDAPSWLEPRPSYPGGLELRATLAYLFAEEAAA